MNATTHMSKSASRGTGAPARLPLLYSAYSAARRGPRAGAVALPRSGGAVSAVNLLPRGRPRHRQHRRPDAHHERQRRSGGGWRRRKQRPVASDSPAAHRAGAGAAVGCAHATSLRAAAHSLVESRLRSPHASARLPRVVCIVAWSHTFAAGVVPRDRDNAYYHGSTTRGLTESQPQSSAASSSSSNKQIRIPL